MSTQRTELDRMEVTVENIGGIHSADVEFEPGVTILAGRNATNRTSLMRAIMAGFGSDDVFLRERTDEGRVDLTLGDESFSRTLTAKDGYTEKSGSPVLDDSALADLFAFLLEDNAARQAVMTDRDLRDVLMRPVDTGDIESHKKDLISERESIESEISRLEEKQSEIPEVQQQIADLQTEVEEVEEELSEKEIALDDTSVEVEKEKKEEQDRRQRKLKEVESLRSQIERKQRSIEAEEQTLEDYREELESLQAEVDELEGAHIDQDRKQELEQRRDEIQTELVETEETVSTLNGLISTNTARLEGDESLQLEAAFDDGGTGGSVTDKLVEGDSMVCWGCGNQVSREEVELTFVVVPRIRCEKNDRVQSLESEAAEIDSELETVSQQVRERKQLESQIDRKARQISSTESKLDDLKSEVDELQDELAEAESGLEAFDDVEVEEEVIELERNVATLEANAADLREEISSTESRLEELRSDVEELEQLESQRDEIDDEINNLEQNIKRIEVEAAEQFTSHMDELLEILDYKNIERVRLDRKVDDSSRSRYEVGTFDMVIARRDEEGVYEAPIDHLSESERELIGLVFALAGYLAHDLASDVPVMLLDSLEAIDSVHIARIIDHFSEVAPFLIVSLLPEDEQAVDDSYSRIHAENF